MPDKKEKTINFPVFITAAGLLVSFLAFGALAPETATRVFPPLLRTLGRNIGWFYVLAVAFFLGVCGWLLFSRFAKIRLGAEDERPQFSTLTWFAMLFSAGMGIGLVFNGVAEPIMHFAKPPGGDGLTLQAAQAALPTTFLHWGLHAWSIYAVTALAIAFFSFRHKLPLTLRSCFYPLLGDRVRGAAGHLIDILAVLATLFGLACSLGLGAMQVSTGLSHVFGWPNGTTTQLVVIAVCTAAATVSLVTGIKRGIRRLSELNMILACILLVLVAALGPFREILVLGVQSLGRYISELPARTFYLGALSDTATDWTIKWTVAYWAWWIAWAPFVGMFVARISRGRTVRQLILGSLLVPSGMTIVWFSVFGGTALHLELTRNAGIASAVVDEISTAIFTMFDQFPISEILSLLALIVVSVFFVTSSDSASYVVDMLASGGHPRPPVWQRIFWATAEGATAAVLLYAGGSVALKALQAGVISMGFPFAILLIIMSISLIVGLRREERGIGIGKASRSRSISL